MMQCVFVLALHESAPTFAPFPTPAPHACCAANDGHDMCNDATSSSGMAFHVDQGKNSKFFNNMNAGIPRDRIVNEVVVECEGSSWDDPKFKVCITAVNPQSAGAPVVDQCSDINDQCSQVVASVEPTPVALAWTATYYCPGTEAGGRAINYGGCDAQCAVTINDEPMPPTPAPAPPTPTPPPGPTPAPAPATCPCVGADYCQFQTTVPWPHPGLCHNSKAVCSCATGCSSADACKDHPTASPTLSPTPAPTMPPTNATAPGSAAHEASKGAFVALGVGIACFAGFMVLGLAVLVVFVVVIAPRIQAKREAAAADEGAVKTEGLDDMAASLLDHDSQGAAATTTTAE